MRTGDAMIHLSEEEVKGAPGLPFAREIPGLPHRGFARDALDLTRQAAVTSAPGCLISISTNAIG
jgi:hypothetical protein